MVDEDNDYKYLVRLPMDSVTEENINKIMQERDRKNAELLTLKQTTETQLWLNELAVLREEYMKTLAVVVGKEPSVNKETSTKKIATKKK